MKDVPTTPQRMAEVRKNIEDSYNRLLAQRRESEATIEAHQSRLENITNQLESIEGQLGLFNQLDNILKQDEQQRQQVKEKAKRRAVEELEAQDQNMEEDTSQEPEVAEVEEPLPPAPAAN